MDLNINHGSALHGALSKNDNCFIRSLYGPATSYVVSYALLTNAMVTAFFVLYCFSKNGEIVEKKADNILRCFFFIIISCGVRKTKSCNR